MEGAGSIPGDLMRQISETRKSAGLTHFELARMLGVPVAFTEILENGIYVCDQDKRHICWPGCIFSPEELNRISRALDRGFDERPEKAKVDDEFLFFWPVTVSSTEIEDDVHDIAENSDIVSCMERQYAYMLDMKFRLYHKQMCMHGKQDAADETKQRVMAMLRNKLCSFQ